MVDYKKFEVIDDYRKITLYNGDCLAAMREMDDDEFDLAIVDPPYGIKRFNRGNLRFCTNDRYKDGIWWNQKPSYEYFEELFRVSRFQIIWGANNFTLPESEYFIIWDKMQTVDNFASAELAWTNIKKPAKVFRYSIHNMLHQKKIHVTQKPVELYKWLLKNYAESGWKILDTHLGSGSIAIACYDMGFDLVGYEIDKEYFESACNRLKQHTSQLALDIFE